MLDSSDLRRIAKLGKPTRYYFSISDHVSTVAVNFLHTAKAAVKFHVSLLFQWPDVRFRVPRDNHYSKIISLLDDVVYCLSGDFIIANLQNLRLRGVRQF